VVPPVVSVLAVLLGVVSVALVVAVILQSGRAAGLSGAIGGGAEAVFGKRKGFDDFLSRTTVVLVVLFFALALVLAYLEQA
jgi:preprotein translocase subunit SecG